MNEFRFIFACKNSLATIKLPVSVGIKKIHYTYDVTLLSTLRFRLISLVPRSPAFRLGHVTAVAMFNGGVHGQAMGSEYYIYMGGSITFSIGVWVIRITLIAMEVRSLFMVHFLL